MDMKSHTHTKECACGHEHPRHGVGFTARWLISTLIVTGLLFVLKPFLAQQMLVRVSSYLTGASYDDAIRVCKKAIFVDKNNLKAWLSLGYIYRQNGRIDKAIAAYERAFALNPEDKRVCFDLGMAYFSRKEITKAIPYFERIRSKGPDKSRTLVLDIINYHRSALTMLSQCYRQSGDIAKAQEVEREMKKYYPLYEKQKIK